MKYYLFIISTFVSLSIYAQDLTVKKAEHVENDLSGRVNLRLDKNENPCALVKVFVASNNAKFDGDIVGDVGFTKGHYDVYMKQESTSLNVKIDTNTKNVNFPDYGIRTLEGRNTYILMLGADFTEAYLNEAKNLSEEFFTTKSFDEQDGEELYMRGSEYWENREYPNAIKYLTRACEKEYPHAFLKMAKIYYDGVGITEDYSKAFYYVQEAIRRNAGGEVLLAEMYDKGLGGIVRNRENASELLLKSANAGSYESMLKVAERYRYGLGIKSDYQTALSWYRKVANSSSNYVSQAKSAIEVMEQEHSISLQSLLTYPLGKPEFGRFQENTTTSMQKKLAKYGIEVSEPQYLCKPYEENLKQTYKGLPFSVMSFNSGGFWKWDYYCVLTLPEEIFCSEDECLSAYDEFLEDIQAIINGDTSTSSISSSIKQIYINKDNLTYSISLKNDRYIFSDEKGWSISLSIYENKNN